MVTDYLKAFFDVLFPFYPKMVIGGIWALKLHGLKTRDTADFDMIVYNPTDELIDILHRLVKEETDSYNFDPEHNRRRSFKITRNGLVMDFLIEYENKKPDDLLCVYYNDILWPVQNIDVVIAAKRKYNRDKDQVDFNNFKQDNF